MESLNRKITLLREQAITPGDIIIMDHKDRNGNIVADPFLIIETFDDVFVALQIQEAPKTNYQDEYLLDDLADYIKDIFNQNAYIEVTTDNGFERKSWILLPETHDIDYDLTDYEVERKIGEFRDAANMRWGTILNRYKDFFDLPKSVDDILGIRTHNKRKKYWR
ncbi:hypothetical protein [Mesoplasma lactucae]|uniref:Uncharacterized protein n=1 Tax=Mesoplasma lactucae ATCC 49193 TaxID=81460 RepID=A0A291ISI8_9MOLU|nr:hypothetical protein [Mesoplasma lactucae]ATG97730.1 hypothetical protein CP520_03265 [Mesoplasma lactucae ATCC 49193]ATZ20494.1 hypothetical protein MLACT_v1c06730 [Mesoplasma lactucae ATCC 49193]MCL8216665.1 hypothetical protein [Mesoplasma lactucae ATCC 49193]